MKQNRGRSVIFNRIPTWCWGATYLALIPVFAVIYTYALRGDFLHLTLQSEPDFDAEAQGAVATLQQTIRQNFRDGHGGDVATVGNLIVAANDIQVTHLSPTHDEVTFEVMVAFRGSRPNLAFGTLAFEATYRTGPGLMVDVSEQPSYELLTFSPEQLSVPGPGQSRQTIPYETIFPLTDGFVVPVLRLPRDAISELNGVEEISQGHPHQLSAQLLRMFYFSSATITTAGYGDIVPVTGWARAAVSAEAILGVVLVGLFLNSLFTARWRTHGRTEQKDVE